MNKISEFQSAHPLSSKKLWKKIFEQTIKNLFFILPFVIIGCILLRADTHIYQIYTLSNALYFILLGIVCLLLVLFIGNYFYFKAFIRRYYYDCGQDFITIKKRVFTPTEIHVQYQKIQDVYVDQDILDRMFGLYDVHIASATITSGIEAHIDGVGGKTAESIKNILLNRIKNNTLESTNAPLPLKMKDEQTATFKSEVEVSSKTYPLSPTWKSQAKIGSVVFAIFFTVIGLFFPIIPSFFAWLISTLHPSVIHIESIPVLSRFFPADFMMPQSEFLFAIFTIINIPVTFICLFFLFYYMSKKVMRNYYFEFTPDYILLKTGFIGREEKHMPYKSIQNIGNDQGIYDRIFGTAEIHIYDASGASGGITIQFQPQEKADELVKILNGILSKIHPQTSESL